MFLEKGVLQREPIKTQDVYKKVNIRVLQREVKHSILQRRFLYSGSEKLKIASGSG